MRGLLGSHRHADADARAQRAPGEHEMLQPSLMSASPTLSHDIPVPQPSDHLFWPEQPSPRLYSVGRPLPKNS